MAPTRLFDFAHHQLKYFPLEKMFTSRLAGVWTSYSTQEFVDTMNMASRALVAAGIVPGDKIALITDANRAEWNMMDNAILQVGAIDVPIYPTMTEQDYEYILNHSESKLVFVSNKELAEKVSRIKDKIPMVKEIYTFEEVPGFTHWKKWMQAGSSIDQSQVDALAANVKEEDLATIIYTSGTTGLPKGVMLNHRNIASNVHDCEGRLPHLEKGKSRCLSFLPCCHIYERMLHYLYVYNGVSIYLTGMDAIKDDLNMAKPHMFTAVPRLLEKVYDGIVAKGLENTGIKKKLFEWALGLALKWEPEGANGAWYEFQLGIARKLVFSKVKSALGLSEIGAIASGSAALQARLARFYNGAGIAVKEGFGLTETSPVISVNSLREPHMLRIGTVGKPIPNVEVKIAEDGEVLCKGPNVMMGYYKAPELTAEVLKDGWFHTGDIGEMRDGFLAITDRKKEMFKTSGGKYVAPQVIENALKESLYIEQCMVIGDGQKFPAALIVPDFVLLAQWAEKNKLGKLSNEELRLHPKVKELFHDEIEKRNARFGKWEQVKAFRLLAAPFAIDKGEITPTLKLKRKAIMQNNANLVTEIYAD